MGVYLAALCAAGAIRAANPAPELALLPSGTTVSSSSAASRAVVLATLVALRAAVHQAFPGLSSFFSGQRSLRRDATADPYRASTSAGDQDLPDSRDPDDPVMRELDKGELRNTLTRAVAHASMLGSIARTRRGVRAQVAWSDRLALWSNTPLEQAAATLEAREQWHSTLLSSLVAYATAIARDAAFTSPRHALGLAVVAAHNAMSSIRTNDRRGGSSIVCPELGKTELMEALHRARHVLSAGFGPVGDRQALVHGVLSRLQRPPAQSPIRPGQPSTALSYDDIVTAVAEGLRPTPFLATYGRLHGAQQAYERLGAQAAQAADAGSFWDKLNIFVASDDEQLRDALEEQTRQSLAAIRADGAAADELLTRALGCYPPAVVYYGLSPVIDSCAAIRAERRKGTYTSRIGKTTVRRTYYYCVIHGKEQAEVRLQAWTRGMVQCFGAIGTPGQLLEKWVSRELA